jgi:hypothetical protein
LHPLGYTVVTIPQGQGDLGSLPAGGEASCVTWKSSITKTDSWLFSFFMYLCQYRPSIFTSTWILIHYYLLLLFIPHILPALAMDSFRWAHVMGCGATPVIFEYFLSNTTRCLAAPVIVPTQLQSESVVLQGALAPLFKKVFRNQDQGTRCSYDNWPGICFQVLSRNRGRSDVYVKVHMLMHIHIVRRLEQFSQETDQSRTTGIPLAFCLVLP